MFSLSDMFPGAGGENDPLAFAVVDGIEEEDAASEASNELLQSRAEALESRLQSALLLDERTGSLVSLESMPRRGAQDLGRQMKKEWDQASLNGGDDADDRSLCTLDSILSEAQKKRTPTFIKVPPGDPVILAQKSWDNLWAREAGEHVEPSLEEKVEPWESLGEQKEDEDEKEEDADFPRVGIDISEDTGDVEFTLPSATTTAATTGRQEEFSVIPRTTTSSREEDNEEENSVKARTTTANSVTVVKSSYPKSNNIPKRKWRLWAGRKGMKREEEHKEDGGYDVGNNIVVTIIDTQSADEMLRRARGDKSYYGDDEAADQEFKVEPEEEGTSVQPAYYTEVDDENEKKQCGHDCCGQSLSF